MLKIKYSNSRVEEWLLKDLEANNIGFEKDKIKFAMKESVADLIGLLVLTPIVQHLSVEAFKYVIKKLGENASELEKTNVQINVAGVRIDIDHNLSRSEKVSKFDSALVIYTKQGTLEKERAKPKHDHTA